ncbi:hypothetical protein A2U01_0084984, partial [Trifolium medium]|nr:hypothetical protein [Trifolium medium]
SLKRGTKKSMRRRTSKRLGEEDNHDKDASGKVIIRPAGSG